MAQKKRSVHSPVFVCSRSLVSTPTACEVMKSRLRLMVPIESSNFRAFPSDAEDEPLRDAKRIREEMIIHILEDDDDAGDRDQMTQDLDTVIKSLQEEITPLPSPQSNDLIPQPDLGYLLEASDDELGLPPAASSPSGDCGGSEEDEVAGFAPIWGYEDEAFDLGFVAIDEPFGFNDALSEPLDLFGGDYADLVF